VRTRTLDQRTHFIHSTGVTVQRKRVASSVNVTTRRLFAAAALAACAISCSGLERNPNVPGTYSDKLSPYNYREEGSLALMVVGVEAARFIREEPYFPLFVQIANKSKLTFDISRESFTLEDSLGRQYGTAPPMEVASKYRRIDLDRRLFNRNRSITSTYIGLFTRISSNFFPSSARRSLVISQVSLPPRAYMEDVLYFPIPETGLNGVPLRLLFRVRGLEEPIQVVFEVPRTLTILEKDDAPEMREDRR
jgi:hypothetical protein